MGKHQRLRASKKADHREAMAKVVTGTPFTPGCSICAYEGRHR